MTATAGYDPNGNLTSQTGTDAGSDAATAARSFGYDGDGRITSANTTAVGSSGTPGYQPATSETYTYNDRGELRTTTGTGGDSTFTYNDDALMTSRSDAAGTSSTSTAYGYNNADQLSTVTDVVTGAAARYSYNNLDQVKQIQYGSGGDVRAFAYDGLHRLTGDTLTSADGTSTVASITYGYDANSNLQSKITTGFAGAATNSYTYDYATGGGGDLSRRLCFRCHCWRSMHNSPQNPFLSISAEPASVQMHITRTSTRRFLRTCCDA